MNPYLNRVEDTYSQRNLLVQRVADAFDCGAHEASAPRLGAKERSNVHVYKGQRLNTKLHPHPYV